MERRCAVRVIWMILLLLGASPAHARSDWDEARASNTVYAYRMFLREHPKSKQAAFAAESLLVREARNDSVNALRRAQLGAYVAGETRIEEFDRFGWDLVEPYHERLGIVRLIVRPDTLTFVVGRIVCTDDSYDRKRRGLRARSRSWVAVEHDSALNIPKVTREDRNRWISTSWTTTLQSVELRGKWYMQSEHQISTPRDPDMGTRAFLVPLLNELRNSPRDRTQGFLDLPLASDHEADQVCVLRFVGGTLAERHFLAGEEARRRRQ